MAIELTLTQAAVAGCLLDGLTDKRIAAATGLEVKTVESHLASMRRRLGETTRVGLALRLQDIGREGAYRIVEGRPPRGIFSRKPGPRRGTSGA